MLINYELWMNSGGLTGQTTIGAVDWNPIVCLGSAFSIPGLKSIGILLLTGVGITAYVRFHDKFSSKDYDERGFTRSKYGTYGTASWMKDKELKEILEIKPPSQADGIILGEKNGSVVCLPKDTRLNRHIAVWCIRYPKIPWRDPSGAVHHTQARRVGSHYGSEGGAL